MADHFPGSISGVLKEELLFHFKIGTNIVKLINGFHPFHARGIFKIFTFRRTTFFI